MTVAMLPPKPKGKPAEPLTVCPRCNHPWHDFQCGVKLDESGWLRCGCDNNLERFR